MRFDWLNDMVGEGLIRDAAAQTIMEDCRSFAKQANAASETTSLLEDIGTGLAGGAGMFLFDKLLRSGVKKYNMHTDLKGMRKTKEMLMQDPQLASDKGKTEARFRELIQYAPALAVDPEKAIRVVKQHLNKGFNDNDIEKLQALQTMMGGGATSAGADSGYSDVFDYEHGLKNKMMKEASVESPREAQLMGSLAFDIYQIQTTALTKEAGIFDRIGKYLGKNEESINRLKDLGSISMMQAAVPAGIGLVAGTGAFIKNKVDQKRFKDKLEQSFTTALRESDPERSLIRENPAHARKAFETLAHFAPNVAAEPRAAKTFMEKMLGYESMGVQPSDVKDLVDIEKNFQQGANRPNPFFSAFSATGKTLGLDKTVNQGLSAASKPYLDEQEQHIRQDLGLPSAFDAKVSEGNA